LKLWGATSDVPQFLQALSHTFYSLPLLALTGHDLAEAIPVILSLIVIEGLLSVDNALAIAAMASRLPGRQKILALRLGILGAYVFRGIALACASLIISNPWVKIIGALYLIHLMAVHFGERSHEEQETHFSDCSEDDEPQTAAVSATTEVTSSTNVEAAPKMLPTASADSTKGAPAVAPRIATASKRGLVATIAAIEFMDLSLSVDNVVAAVVMSPKLWVVCTGVFIGILALRLVAGFCIKLIERYPILEHTAFLLIGYVGFLLFFELGTGVDVHALGKFIGIAIIIALSMIYSRSAVMVSILRPAVWLSGLLMRAYARVVNAILAGIMYPWRAIAGR
jgi:YkoY family integral membrane protein